MPVTRGWTTVEHIIATLRKRWDSGQYARAYAAGEAWVPVTISVKAPTGTELLEHFDEAIAWVERFQRESRTAAGSQRFLIEYRTIKGRALGENAVPVRIRVESLAQLCRLLGVTRDVTALDAIMARTRTLVPGLLAWVISHPLVAVKHEGIWEEVLAVVAWIAATDVRDVYVRQLDVEGVDTKFVERHQKLLDDVLTAVLPPDRVASDAPRADFARRFRFRQKPRYTRLRLLCPQVMLPVGISELSLRTDELAAIELPVAHVFVVENEVTYLAFPKKRDAIVLFGAGFGVTMLQDLSWLDHKQIVYWGDIDTHGFVMLNRLRARFSSVRSILMDHETLFAHPRQWGTDSSPTNRPLPHLTDSESALYHDLIEDRYGRAVRLEQERVRFSLVRRALRPWEPCRATAVSGNNELATPSLSEDGWPRPAAPAG